MDSELIITKTESNTSFISDLVKYFRDFLETDFHKRRIPKRSIRYRDEKNLSLGLKLIKYRKFHESLIDVIVNNTFKTKVIKIKLNKYKTVLPGNILDLINKKIDSFKKYEINQLIKDSEESIHSAANLYKKNVDSALTYSLDLVQKLLSKYIVDPLMESIEEPIKLKSSVHVEPIYIWKENLDDIFIESIREFISISVNNILVNKANINRSEFETIWNLDFFKN